MADEKILVIDDTPVICTALDRELSQAGYEVDCALSAEDAIAKIKSKKYDVIFVDMVLPGIDGIKACKEIKKLSPGSIPVFMTGKIDKDPIYKEIEFVKAGGKTYYLYKPFAEGEVLEAARKALSEKNK